MSNRYDYTPGQARVTAFGWSPIDQTSRDRTKQMLPRIHTATTVPYTGWDYERGVHLTTHKTYLYRAQIRAVDNKSFKPGARYDHGIANVTSAPIYTIDRVSELPSVMITGEITGMPILRKLDPRPIKRERFETRENVFPEYTRDDWKSDVMHADPNDCAAPWANELTDGYRLSGDHNTETNTPNARFVRTDMIPADVLANWDKQKGAVQRFWIGVCFIENNIGARWDAGRLSASIGLRFHVHDSTVRRNSDFAKQCMAKPKLAKTHGLPKRKLVMDTPITGDWELHMNTKMRAPWDTMDGDRPFAEWGFDGPMDRADAQRRAALDSN